MPLHPLAPGSPTVGVQHVLILVPTFHLGHMFGFHGLKVTKDALSDDITPVVVTQVKRSSMYSQWPVRPDFGQILHPGDNEAWQSEGAISRVTKDMAGRQRPLF